MSKTFNELKKIEEQRSNGSGKKQHTDVQPQLCVQLQPQARKEPLPKQPSGQRHFSKGRAWIAIIFTVLFILLLSAVNLKLLATVKDYSREKRDTITMLGEIKEALNNTTTQINSFSKSIENFDINVQSLKTELSAANTKIATLESKSNSQSEVIESLVKLNDALIKSHESLIKSKNALVNKMDSQELEIKDIKSAVKSISEANIVSGFPAPEEPKSP